MIAPTRSSPPNACGTCSVGLLALLICLSSLPAPAAPLTIDARSATTKTGGRAVQDAWELWSNGHVAQPLRIATAGKYQIVIRAYGTPAGGVWPEMALLVDGIQLQAVSVAGEKPDDYRFEVDLAAGVCELAAAFTNDAIIGTEDRNLFVARITIIAPPGAAADPALATLKDIAVQAEQREREALAATDAAIEKNRKGDVTLHLVDSTGKPLASTKVTIEQTSHEFLFGCNIYGFDHMGDDARNAAYKQRFEDLFNYATVGFYWKGFERERGKPNWEHNDAVVDWCTKRGIRMKGHPLLWGNEAGIPPWSKGLPAEDIQRQRVHDIVTRYQGRITFWEVVNEPSHLPLPKIDGPYRWAREFDPTGYLIVNDYHVLDDGAPRFYQLLKDAIASGVPFDGIGIQAHEPRTMRFPLPSVQHTLDHYAMLGKELHITEFTPCSSGDPITGSHVAGTWDEAAQADYAIKFYRLCFAHPAIRAITWWDLCDRGSWLKGGGLLRADATPKPAYEQLHHLIRDEWHTSLAATTDARGALALRGFYGDYRITSESGAPRTFKIAKGGERAVTVTFAPAK